MSDRRLLLWAFAGVIAASELQVFGGLGICGWLRVHQNLDACPEFAQNAHANRESLIAGLLGLMAGFAAAGGADP